MGYGRTLILLTIELLDSLLLSTIYFIIGFFTAIGIDAFFGKFDSYDDQDKSTLRLLLEAIIYTTVLLFFYYIIVTAVNYIPFPFDGIYGFEHSDLKAQSAGVIFVFVLFYYQNYYTDKLTFLHNRIIKETTSS